MDFPIKCYFNGAEYSDDPTLLSTAINDEISQADLEKRQ